MSESESEPVKRYALRFIADAVQTIEDAFHHMADTAGFDLAQEWRGRLAKEIASLATNPRRFPLAPEHRHFPMSEANETGCWRNVNTKRGSEMNDG